MLASQPFNFRNKLFALFALISIVPLAIVGVIVSQRVNQGYSQTLTDSFEKQASITKQNLLYFFESNRSYIQSLAAQDILLGEMTRYVDTKQAGQAQIFDPSGTIFSTLVSVRRENSFFEKVYIVDTVGQILVSTATDDVGKNISSLEHFKNPVKNRSTFIGKVIHQEKDRVIPLSSPFLRKNNNQVVGLLVIELNTSIIKALFDGTLVLQSTANTDIVRNASVIDDEGYILDVAQVRQVKSSAQKKCVEEGQEQVGEWQGINGEKVFGVSKCVKVGDLTWTLLIEQPLSEAFALGRGLTNTIIVITVVVTLLLLLITVAVSRSITKPIMELIAESRLLGKGEMATPIKLATHDEFQDLAQSFNDMASQLKSVIYNLTAERNKLEVVLSGVKDAVIAVDLNHKITLFNKAAELLTGYRQKEVIGKNISELIRIFDNAQEIHINEYCPIRWDSFEGILYSKNNVKIVVNNDQLVYANFVSGKISEGAHVNLGCILTLHDVTAEQQLEEMKLDFVSMAAHELRTPLTSIRGYADILKDEIGSKLSSEQQQYLQRLASSSENLANLIDNLLSVSRIERGAFKIEPAPVDIIRLIQQALDSFAQNAKTKNQELTFTQPSEPIPAVFADNFRINQVLSNLLQNAVTYTPLDGKINVSLRTEKSEVGKERVVVSVADTGPGIPPEAIPKLFTKFFRVSGSLEAGSKGTGLGLFICKSIVTLHHGEIWVNSKLGHGSTFTFTLPTINSKEKSEFERRKTAAKFPKDESRGIMRRHEN